MGKVLQVSGVFVILVSGCAPGPRRPAVSAAAGEPVQGPILVNVDERGLALQGYDPVGYFLEHKPVKGTAAHQLAYKGAIYQFASAQNKAAFEANPARYEPQFGGFCAYAASINKVSPISVEYFEIVDGRLLLQHNQKAWDLWHRDAGNSLRKADMNWPGLVRQNGT